MKHSVEIRGSFQNLLVISGKGTRFDLLRKASYEMKPEINLKEKLSPSETFGSSQKTLRAINESIIIILRQ